MTPARLAPLLAALALTACAVGAPLAPPPGTEFAGPTVAGADGAPLALSVWPAEGPERAVLLAVHGYGDYGPRAFGEHAPGWAEAGITVYAYDQRGFGRNPSRLYWPGEAALIDDFAAVAADIAERHPGAPLVAMGHSMGGGVVLAALGEGRAPAVDGAILLGPAIAGGDQVPTTTRAGVWLLGAFAADSRFTGAGVVEVRPTDDPEALRRLASDPLHVGAPSGREILGLLRVMDRAAAAAPAAATPVLVLHGERDELVDPAKVRAVAATIPGREAEVYYSDGWHLLLDDLQKARVAGDIRDWVLSRAGGEG